MDDRLFYLLSVVATAAASLATPALATPAIAGPGPAGAAEPSSSLLEVGLAAGAFMASPDHELYDARVGGHVALSAASPEIGLRLAYFPLSFVGAEAEGQFIPVSTITDRNAYVMAFRAHVMLQLPMRLTPFVLAGGGTLGLSSGTDALGNDFDRAFHWGLGAKYWLDDRFSVRVDGRHIVSGGRGEGDGNTSHFEALIGLGFALWKADDPLPLSAPSESPIRIVEAPPPPPPEPEPVPAPVVTEPVATVMQAPEEVVEAVLDRVHFAWGSAALRPQDKGHLDEAVVLLNRHASLAVQVIGHTDSTGPYRYNLTLSRRRAQAVQAYLLAAGIAEDRVAIVGAGPDEPLDSNDTAHGRARNRRIEFSVRDPLNPTIRLRMRESLNRAPTDPTAGGAEPPPPADGAKTWLSLGGEP